jgi:hypothetical protein
MSWQGQERRSPESLLARAVVSAKAEAEQFEEELGSVPRRKARERAKLRRELKEARRRERDSLFVLRSA